MTTGQRNIPGLQEMMTYMRSQGWKQTELYGKHGAIWTPTDAPSGDYEILLPITTKIGDFRQRMGEALQNLVLFEKRSRESILHDIHATTMDIIRVRIQQGVAEEETLPFEYGKRVVQAAYDMMLAAAEMTVEQETLEASWEIGRFMAGLRLGQTERDGYVMILYSPVPPRLQKVRSAAEQEETPTEAEDPMEQEPFARRVTLTLAQTLEIIQGAIIQAAATGQLQLFQQSQAIKNCCAALAEMSMHDTVQEVSLHIHWASARTRQDTALGDFAIRFTADTFPVLREAARLLRTAPTPTLPLNDLDPTAVAGKELVPATAGVK